MKMIEIKGHLINLKKITYAKVVEPWISQPQQDWMIRFGFTGSEDNYLEIEFNGESEARAYFSLLVDKLEAEELAVQCEKAEELDADCDQGKDIIDVFFENLFSKEK